MGAEEEEIEREGEGRWIEEEETAAEEEGMDAEEEGRSTEGEEVEVEEAVVAFLFLFFVKAA